MAVHYFTIRSMAHRGITVADLRRAVIEAPAESNLVLLQDGTICFPPVCCNCERPAASALRIRRAFQFRIHRAHDIPDEKIHHIDEFDAPFCDACVQQHRQELKPPDPWLPLRRILSNADGFAGVAVVGIALIFVVSTLKDLSMFPLLLAGIPLSTGFWLLRGTWNKSRYMSLPEPTPVDSAVDFSPSLGLDFEPAWRAFQFRSPRYAELFRQANGTELWNPHSAEAQSAATQRRRKTFKTNLVIGAIIVAILLWKLWDSFAR